MIKEQEQLPFDSNKGMVKYSKDPRRWVPNVRQQIGARKQQNLLP